MSNRIDSQVCKVLDHAVLFCLFDRRGDDASPPQMWTHIMQAYGDLGVRNALEVGCNPVILRPFLVSGHETEVVMDFLEEEGIGV